MAQQHEQETGGTGPGHRSVQMSRTDMGTYLVTNARGGTMSIGSGESDDFTPVELLLTAIGGCSAIDVDFITSRLAEPTEFTVITGGEKLRDEHGNHMGEIEVTFRVRFPEGDDGDRARERLPRAIAQSHDRLCTVSRSVQLGTPVHMRED
jgi:putative redox protein